MLERIKGVQGCEIFSTNLEKNKQEIMKMQREFSEKNHRELREKMETNEPLIGLKGMISESKKDLADEFELTGEILGILTTTLLDVAKIDLKPSEIQNTLIQSKLNIELKDLKLQDAPSAKELICKAANKKVYAVVQFDTVHPVNKKWSATENKFKEKYPTFSWKG
jgi:hypothetical protein